MVWMVAGLGCTASERVVVDASTLQFDVAFVVVVDKHGTPMSASSAAVHPDLSDGRAGAAPIVETSDGQDSFLVAVPPGSLQNQGVCFDRELQLRLSPGLPDEGPPPPTLLQSIQIRLPEGTQIYRFDANTRGLKRVSDATPIPWLTDLRLAYTVDSEACRPPVKDIVPFLSQPYELLPLLPTDTVTVMDLDWIDDDRLLVATGGGMALVFAGEPYAQVPGRWLDLDEVSNDEFSGGLHEVATETQPDGTVEIVGVGGFRRGEDVLTYAGYIVRGQLVDQTLRWLDYRRYDDVWLSAVAVRDGEVLVGGSERELYRFSLMDPIPPQAVWQVPLRDAIAVDRDYVARIIMTGDANHPYALTARNAEYIYNAAQDSWQINGLESLSATPEDVSMFGYTMERPNAPNGPWWIASDRGGLWRRDSMSDPWRPVALTFPPRFADCGIYNASQGVFEYGRGSFDDVFVIDDHVYLSLRTCRALVTFPKTAILNGRTTCMSLVFSEADGGASCAGESSESYQIFAEGPMARRAVFRVRGRDWVSFTRDGALMVSRASR